MIDEDSPERSPIEDPGQRRALALAVRHVNASNPVPITAANLRTILITGQIPPRFENHVFAFIDETHPATLCDLVLSRAVTYGKLAALADRMLQPSHPTRQWLDDRRGL